MQRPPKRLARIIAAEVGPPDITHEQRIAGQNHPWLGGPRSIGDDEGNTLCRVPWGV